MEEQFDTIKLNDGINTHEYYVLDHPFVNKKQYIVIYPVDSMDGEVVIMSVTKAKGKSDIYASVTDEEVEAVFKVFEKNHPEFF